MLKYAALIALPVLAACSAGETTALMEDPNGFLCREGAVGKAGVSFDETSAQPINTDIFGTANYDVTAGGATYRCVVDSDGVVVSLEKI